MKRHNWVSFVLTGLFLPLLSPTPTHSQTNSAPSPARPPANLAAPADRAMPLSETALCSLKFGSTGQDRCKITLTDGGFTVDLTPGTSSSGTSSFNSSSGNNTGSRTGPTAENRPSGSQRFVISGADLLGFYARPPLLTSSSSSPAASGRSGSASASPEPNRSPEPVTLEIDFLLSRPMAASSQPMGSQGNQTNSLRLRLSQPFAMALQNRVIVRDRTTDRALRQRLSPAISDIGDRTSQLQRLIDTKTCIRCELSGVDLGGIDLSGANLEGTHLEGANLSGVNLSGAYLVGASLVNANLDRADLSNARLSFAALQAVNLAGAELTNLQAQNTLFQGANFSNANLQGADLTQANLANANLADANLGVYRSEPSSPVGIPVGTTVEVSTNGTPTAAPLPSPTRHVTILRGANLNYANLQGADLEQALLDRASLREANLTNARLQATDLRSASLCEAVLPDGNRSRQGC
jgi:uncharacterized protein YjbI with pentapeptide repeats